MRGGGMCRAFLFRDYFVNTFIAMLFQLLWNSSI